MRKLKCLLVISKWHSSIHWQLSVKAMNLTVNFFFCNLAVLAVIFRVRSNWFSISRIHWCGSFFFAVPWSQLTSISFFNFLHRKEQVWCFQNVTNRQSWCIFLVELSKPYLLNRNAYVLSIQHPRITSLGRCFYANSYTDVSNDIFWNQVRALEKKIISHTNLTLKSNCWQTIGTIKHSWNSAG